MLKIGLILIGDEILSGRTQDLNGHWLARFLHKKNQCLAQIQVISDNLEIITHSIQQALKNFDVVITSGGIGPTLDDKTKLALAGVFGTKLMHNSQAEELVKLQYKRLDKIWTPKTNQYHMLPEQIQPLSNPKGLAPGLMWSENNKFLLSAPGVPREFEAMVEFEFMPKVFSAFSTQTNPCLPITIRTRELPEEKIFFELGPNLWQDLERFGKVSSLPQTMGIDIVITPPPLTSDLARQKIEQEIKKIVENSLIAPNIWQWGELSLPAYILAQAKLKKITIGLAESCTGGLVASLITDTAGASEVFQGSIVCYSNEVKINCLGVKEKTLADFGAVSEQTAQEMAVGAAKALNCHLALSFSGITGPGGGSDLKPVGTVAIAIAQQNFKEKNIQVKSWILNYQGDRLRLKSRFSEKGLFLLLDAIAKY